MDDPKRIRYFFSAPRVAGGAALVKATFPWMTGYNLQQTLLTTSTYHSDAYTEYDPDNSYYESIYDDDGNLVEIIFHRAEKRWPIPPTDALTMTPLAGAI